MQQPHQTRKYVPVPINRGTLPDWETRLGYPQLLNMFVGESGHLYCTPGLLSVLDSALDDNARAVQQSIYNGTQYFVVTDSRILIITPGMGYEVIAIIKNTNLPVQMAENLQGQMGIVDGLNFYVYDQNTKGFIVMGPTEGFQFKTPISIVVLNSVCIVLDGSTNSWAISQVNNMLSWPVLDNVPQIEAQLTNAVSLATLSSNLYIFGSTGIERWVPNSGNNPYLFAFTRDDNYRKDFGAIGTNSIDRGFDEIYFLSSKFTPMSLSVSGGLRELTPSKMEEGGPSPGISGMSKIISQYIDVMRCEACFYTFSGNYFYSMTFPETGVNWTYCQNSNTWANNDDLIICSTFDGTIVGNSTGISTLELEPQSTKKRQWRSERIVNYKGLEPFRTTLCGFEPRIVQGLQSTGKQEYMELTISVDSQSWLNTVRRPIGLTGQRNAVDVWLMNIAAYEFTFLLTYQGMLNLTIEKANAIIK